MYNNTGNLYCLGEKNNLIYNVHSIGGAGNILTAITCVHKNSQWPLHIGVTCIISGAFAPTNQQPPINYPCSRLRAEASASVREED